MKSYSNQLSYVPEKRTAMRICTPPFNVISSKITSTFFCTETFYSTKDSNLRFFQRLL